jgi:hypothetical protein
VPTHAVGDEILLVFEAETVAVAEPVGVGLSTSGRFFHVSYFELLAAAIGIPKMPCPLSCCAMSDGL